MQNVRVGDDSRTAAGIASADLATREGKGILTGFADEEVAQGPASLAALYILKPSSAETELTREQVGPVAATLMLLANFKLARMTGGSEAPEVLRRAAIVADRVPVYALTVPRDLALLAQVASRLLGWHGGAAKHSSAGVAR
jgi:hypothetical protein